MLKYIKIGSVVLILFSVLASCSPKEIEEPLPFSDEKIINILIDVHISEAALQTLGRVVKDSMKEVYMNQVAEIHEIERQQLEELLGELRNRPADLKRLYSGMLEEIEIKENELKAKSENTKNKKDTTDIIEVNEQKLKDSIK
ncbi:MAG: DUF4296 domain-containing protein [Bacteroidetes bacterium]|nr:MAG: DUF4296 domain-containing protein [Bacteroidota bacterium]